MIASTPLTLLLLFGLALAALALSERRTRRCPDSEGQPVW
jgi:hypothetical protein